MKPNSKQNRTLSGRANRAFEQARSHFGRAMIDALSNSLEALGGRLGGEKLETFQDPGQVEDQPRHRLRRMLQSDRGLGARTHEPTYPARQPELAEPALTNHAAVDSSAEDAEVPAIARPDVACEVSAPITDETSQEIADEPATTELVAAESIPEPIPVVEPIVAEATPASAQEEPPQAVQMMPPSASDDEAPVCDEPIRTRSMARLLASQGHHRRALSIYDVLLATNASDTTLAAEAAALRTLAEQPMTTQQ